MKAPKEYLQQPYARMVIPVNPNCYHAEILEFPGCFAQGNSPENAYANLEVAAESWIDTCISQGQEIPEPSSNLTFSGNIALRLPKSIHRHAVRLAERDNTSLNTFLISAISARVGAEDFYKKMADRIEHRMMQATYAACTFASFVVAHTEARNKRILPSTSFSWSGVTGSSKQLLPESTRR
jgi:antitoxin HicB